MELPLMGKALGEGKERWVRAASWSEEERTLSLHLHPPPSAALAEFLAPPAHLCIYFPTVDTDAPFASWVGDLLIDR